MNRNESTDERPELTLHRQRWHSYLWQKSEVEVPASRNPDLPVFGEETFARLFGTYIREKPREEWVPWAAKLTDLAHELPEWQSLRKTCQGNALMAAVAAEAVTAKVAESLPEEPPPATKNFSAVRRMIKGLADLGIEPSPDLAAAAAEAEAAQEAYARLLDDVRCRSVLRRACEEAREETEKIAGAMAGVGLGDVMSASPEDAMALWQKLRNNMYLIRLAELAGRYIRRARILFRERPDQYPAEITDITLGGDLAHVLPSEIVQLTHPQMRRVFLRKLVTRQLLCYHLEDRGRDEKGPLIFCLDNSGSMDGEKDAHAKAMALAMADVARMQKRPFGLVLFSDGIRHAQAFRSTPAIDELIDAISVKPSGGTSFRPPLEEAFRMIDASEAFHKADIIFLTDGEEDKLRHDTEILARIARRKENDGLRIFAVGIGHASKLKDMSDSLAFADTVFLHDTRIPLDADDGIFQTAFEDLTGRI